MMKIIILVLIAASANFASAQSRRAPEIKSCLSSEFALSALENADNGKTWNENFEAGKDIGYIVAEYYQKAIWAMNNPEVEGRDAVLFALQSSQERIKYMKIDDLRRDVKRCRASFK
jgi:hypothetical protein